MNIRRVAVIFDNKLRPETTGGYCLRALGELVEAVHFLPEQCPQIPAAGFDLYLNIDDGLRYRLPAQLRPAAWWAIDTHLDPDWYRAKGPDFDFVFTAQRDGAEQLRRAGLPRVQWLPLACDPAIHRPHDVSVQFDVSFVGNAFPGPREELLTLLQQEFPASFVGQQFGDEMARVYSASRTVFNRSIRNDINMRVFEALGCGALLLTNDLADNGQAELFTDGEHFATYRDADELVEKIRWYLAHDDVRTKVAAAGRNLVLQKHTYRQRMESLLRQVEQSLSRTSVACKVDPQYFAHARPELLALIAPTAERVLDVGCGAGMLGAALKARQGAFVCGIEMAPSAAHAARSRLDQVVEGDVEHIELPYPPAYFDCVVCGDVIEHLVDPAAFLRRVRRWLTPGGRLVASVPNVRHYSVVENLLAGNFGYEPAGLLDRDHLRFFTRRDFVGALEAAGFEIRQTQIVPGPGYQEWTALGQPGNLRIGRLTLQGLSVEEAQEFLAYQYLITAIACRRPAPPEPDEQPAASEPAAKLGCVLAIRDRPVEYLTRTFQTYQYQTRQPDDRVLVDYGSDPSVAQAYRAACDAHGWRYAHIEPVGAAWSSSAAYNHAIQLLADDIDVVFKNDVDVLLGHDVLQRATRLGQARLCGFCCSSTHADSRYPARFDCEDDLIQLLRDDVPPRAMDAEGIFAFPRAWFHEIGGFDLAMEGWGFEDSDLRLRAQRSIGAMRDPAPILVHQWHARNYAPEQVLKNRAYYESTKHNGSLVRNGGPLARATSLSS